MKREIGFGADVCAWPTTVHLNRPRAARVCDQRLPCRRSNGDLRRDGPPELV